VEPGLPALPGDLAGLAAQAAESRPMVREMALEVRRQEVREQLARKDAWPNLELQAGVMHMGAGELPAADEPMKTAGAAAAEALQMPGDTTVSAGVMFTLPLWKGAKQDQRAAEARHAQESARLRLESARLAVALEVETLAGELERIREQLRLYEQQVLPRAQQAVQSALESYQVGQADFLTLLSSQIAVLDYDIERHRLQVQYHKRLARLYQAMGRTEPGLGSDLHASGKVETP
jgi:outer membrane protein TolC